MINVNYQPDLKEEATVSLAFIESRPLIKIVILMTNVAVLLMLSVASLLFFSNTLRIQDLSIILFAIIWFYYRRPIQIYIVKQAIARYIRGCSPWSYTIDEYKIKGNKLTQVIDLSWRHIRKIYEFKNIPGYIIPLPGLKQACKFIWLPVPAFKEQDLDRFQQLLENKKIKVVSMK